MPEQPFHIVLERLYKDVDGRNSSPIAQSNIRSDDKCICLWTDINECDGNITLPDLSTVSKPGDVVYKQYPSTNEGMLHWTLFQFQTFGSIIDDDIVKLNGDIIENIMRTFPQISITFKGLMRTKHGIAMCGYPSFNVDDIRHQFRRGVKDIVEPHPQNICHITLIRFGNNPCANVISELIERYSSTTFSTIDVKLWKYGFGTWMQRREDVKIVKEIYTPLWILHRGLSSGPDRIIENNISHIRQMLDDGWSVEVDLRMNDGVVYIGHDEDSVNILPEQDLEILLIHPRVYIHCKNLEMCSYLSSLKIVGCKYFVHDTDDATLTSNGKIWCYPRKWCNTNCIVVLPENDEHISKNVLTKSYVYGVCSDFTPSYFMLLK
jgi:hypothetical protein